MLTGESPAYVGQKQGTHLPTKLMTERWAEPLLSVLSKATFDEPRYRYQSVQQFYCALRQIWDLTEIGSAAPMSSTREGCENDPPPKFTRFEVPVLNTNSAAATLPVNAFVSSGVLGEFRRLGRDAWDNIPSLLIVQILAIIAVVAVVLITASQILPLFKR